MLAQAAPGPALGDGLDAREESHALRAVLVEVAARRPLPAAERVIGARHRNGNVDSDHSDVHPARELAGGIAVAGEDRDTVAILVIRGQCERRIEIGRARHLKDRPENLALIGLHLWRDPIEQRPPEEESLLVTLEAEAPS